MPAYFYDSKLTLLLFLCQTRHVIATSVAKTLPKLGTSKSFGTKDAIVAVMKSQESESEPPTFVKLLQSLFVT